MPLYAHLSIGVQWNPKLHYDPFLFTLFTPMKARFTIVWLCLVIQCFIEVEWPETVHNMAPSHDGNSVIGFILKS
jgi:hypothetical protein